MSSSNSLHVIVLDVSPFTWALRDRHKQHNAKKLAEGDTKASQGPASLGELLQAIQLFCGAVTSMEREAGILIMGVADGEVAIVYPRKDVLAQWLAHPESYQPNREIMAAQLVSGVADLVARAHARAEKGQPVVREAAMAAAFSRALCLVNRFLVAAKSTVGLSALSEDRFLPRSDQEEGIVMALKGNKKKSTTTTTQSAWAPRIFLVQASNDRGPDYNAMMNCAFASIKHQIMVDACYLRLGRESSPFLEQVCDLTGGLFLAPNDRTQGQGGLAQILLSVFLAPLHCRRQMKLPGLNQVDFRARCFESGAMVDRAFVCNQCLSVFSKKPTDMCPTCGAWILDKTSAGCRVGA